MDEVDSDYEESEESDDINNKVSERSYSFSSLNPMVPEQ